MQFKEIVNRIKSTFFITSQELYIISILLIGSLIGVLIQPINNNDDILIKKAFTIAEQNTEKSLESNSEKIQESNSSESNTLGSNTTESSSNINQTQQVKKLTVEDAYANESNKINLNTASKSELMRIPGVGEKTAEKIIEYRQSQKFSAPRDIMKIKGIGTKKYEKIKEIIIAK